MTYATYSSRETKNLAARFIQGAVKRRSRGALVVGLVGELGTGKTTFVQGCFEGLGIRRRATSPTFILLRRITLKHPRLKNLYHLDLYRLHDPRELLNLGWKEIIRSSNHLVLVEWANKGNKILPRDTIYINFEHGQIQKERTIYLKAALI